MRVEGATGKANIRRRVVAKALHPSPLTAQHANGQSAAQGFSVGHQIGLHAEVFLRATWGQTETQENFIKNQRNTARRANLAQLAQPGGIGSSIKVRLARAVQQAGIAGCRGVGVQSLQRVDQHAGDVAAAAQHPQSALAHFGQGKRIARGHGVADARLHIAPPAVVRATKAHHFVAPAVVARQPHGLHHGLGSRHVEGNLFHAGYALQALQVVRHDRVVSTQHRAEITHHCRALFDAALVKVVAQQVHAVGTGEIKKAVAIQIGDRDAFGGGHERSDLQTLAHQFFELEGYAVGADELQIRQGAHHIGGGVQAFRIAGLELLHQTGKGRPAACHHIGRRAIDAIGLLFVVGVARQQCRYPTRCARVARQPRVLGQGQLHPGPRFVQCPQRSTRADSIKRQGACCQLLIHTCFPFLSVN